MMWQRYVLVGGVVAMLLGAGGDAHAAKRRKKEPEAPVVTWQYGTVVRVVDGDTLVLADGTKVRLLDINTPELAHRGMPADGGGPEAKRRTEELVLNKEVALRLGARKYDDYDRLLAHVLYADPQGGGAAPMNLWLNGTLVREGYASVYTFPDNRVYPLQLQALEEQARGEKRGIWAAKRWRIRQADTCCEDADMAKFQLVDGTVKSVSRADKMWYLNFGEDYRTDFTVEIPQKDFTKQFKKGAGIDDLAAMYKGRKVRVRGIVKPVNGAMIRVTHPEQLQLLDGPPRTAVHNGTLLQGF